MLIHLDSSGVADCAPGSPTQARSRAAIENLLLAHFEGSHAISLSPPDAELLCAASPPWSERAARALDHIEESYSQIAGLRAEVPLALELGIGADFDSREHEVSGGQAVRHGAGVGARALTSAHLNTHSAQGGPALRTPRGVAIYPLPPGAATKEQRPIWEGRAARTKRSEEHRPGVGNWLVG